MSTLALTATEGAAWVALITAVAAGIVAIIGAWKGKAADTKADANADRLASHADSIRQLRDEQMTTARAMDPHATAADPIRPAATSFRPPGT